MKKLFLTRRKPEQIVIFAGWMFVILGVVASFITLFLIIMMEAIRDLWVENPDFPYLQSLFMNLPLLLALSLVWDY